MNNGKSIFFIITLLSLSMVQLAKCQEENIYYLLEKDSSNFIYLLSGPSLTSFNFTENQTAYTFPLKDKFLLGVDYHLIVTDTSSWRNNYSIHVKTNSVEYMPWDRSSYVNNSSLSFTFFKFKITKRAHLKFKASLRDYQVLGYLQEGYRVNELVSYPDQLLFVLKDYRVGPEYTLIYKPFSLSFYLNFSNHSYGGYSSNDGTNSTSHHRLFKTNNAFGGMIHLAYQKNLNRFTTIHLSAFTSREFIGFNNQVNTSLRFKLSKRIGLCFQAYAEQFTSYNSNPLNINHLEKGRTNSVLFGLEYQIK